ncbi:hypothetical protein CCB80_10725 [Armatimonadetes bacterium Uphvl-Ar1]|nr:hypothetical protein CCB80_10725 [Armatimonadetes bacterium Uphvl-Ar1]
MRNSILPISLLVCAVSSGGQFEPETLYKRVSPSIVTVESESANGVSTGTGFFVKDDRHVATAYHVIKGSNKIKLFGSDGKELGIQAVVVDVENDLAILRLREGSGYKNLILVSQDDVKIGSKILVIGNTLGFLERSISDGIVSGIRRIGTGDFVQFTAPVSQGNSGGPLLNEQGKVLGVVTFSFTEGQNVNIAVSSGNLKTLLWREFQNYDDFLRREKAVIADVSESKGKESSESAPSADSIREYYQRSMNGIFRAHNSMWIKMQNYKGDPVQIYDLLDQFRLEVVSSLSNPPFGSNRNEEQWKYVSDMLNSGLEYCNSRAKYLIEINYGSNRSARDEAWENLLTSDGKFNESLSMYFKFVFGQREVMSVDLLSFLPDIMFSRGLPNLGFVPNLQYQNMCVVGWVQKDSSFKVGEVIKSVRYPGKSAVAVSNWKSLYNFFDKRGDEKVVFFSTNMRQDFPVVIK